MPPDNLARAHQGLLTRRQLANADKIKIGLCHEKFFSPISHIFGMEGYIQADN